MALILLIETATHLCSVALVQDGQILSTREEESDKLTHAEKLNVFIDEVLRESSVAIKGLDAVAVGIGPGSYTGLRIGLSAAKGLCFAIDRPIIGISTLETLVNDLGTTHPRLWDTEALMPMIDARRMEVFTQTFHSDGAAQDEPAPLVLDGSWIEALGSRPVMVFGDGADKAKDFLALQANIQHVSGVRPHAAAMASIAQARFSANRFDDLAYLVPLYGKEANVTQSTKKA